MHMRTLSILALSFAFWIVSGAVAVTPDENQPARPNRLLFMSNRADKEGIGIYSMKPDGSDQKALTKGGGIELDPVWSPDGKRIAFAVLPNPSEPKAEIYVMNADGSDRKALTKEGEFSLSPVWSPDGKQIAYGTMQITQSGEAPKMSVYVMDADGSNRKRLGDGLVPCWSADGKKILYTALTGKDPGLYVMDADGSHSKRLTDAKAAMGVWSPDGKRIVCIAEGTGDQPEITVMNADGSQPVTLTKTPDMEFGPQWSTDGKQIYFSRLIRGQDHSRSGIYVIDADGKNERKLTADDSMNALTGALFLIISRIEAARPQ